MSAACDHAIPLNRMRGGWDSDLAARVCESRIGLAAGFVSERVNGDHRRPGDVGLSYVSTF